MTPAAGAVWRWQFGSPVGPLAALLAAGGVVAIPTESSYGLAAVPTSAAGVEAIYRVKGRERGKALPVVVAGLAQLAGLGIAPDLPILMRLSAFWPGPLTVVVPLAAGSGAAAPPAAAGGTSLAVRIPGHARLLELLEQLGHGLTATSANRSGGEPILDPGEVAALLGASLGAAAAAGAGTAGAAVVDGGILAGGPPSTMVVAVAAPDAPDGWGVKVLRAGSVPVERLREQVRVLA